MDKKYKGKKINSKLYNDPSWAPDVYSGNAKHRPKSSKKNRPLNSMNNTRDQYWTDRADKWLENNT